VGHTYEGVVFGQGPCRADRVRWAVTDAYGLEENDEI